MAPDHPSGGETRNTAYAGVGRQLRANGYSPLPLCDKKPVIAGWPAIFCERLPSLDEIEQEWSSALRGSHEMNGVGIATASRNGNRDLAALYKQVTADTLVLWGWNPGVRRQPAPGTPAEFGTLMQAWAATGAACPAS